MGEDVANAICGRRRGKRITSHITRLTCPSYIIIMLCVCVCVRVCACACVCICVYTYTQIMRQNLSPNPTEEPGRDPLAELITEGIGRARASALPGALLDDAWLSSQRATVREHSMCVCVCVCACVCVCMYACMLACMHVYIHTYIHTYIYIYICIYVCV
jgi:hypothetical protein